jgi:putative copper export protein/mono/diheme cytochrome c family protein
MMLNGAMPGFEFDAGGLLVPVLRSLSVTALFSVFGTLVFQCAVAPRAFVGAPPAAIGATERALWRLAQGSVAAGLAALLGWLVIESAALADAEDFAQTVAALPKVLGETSFGHVILLQMAALLATGLAFGRGRGRRRGQAAALCAGLATMLQAGHSHAFSTAGGDLPLMLSMIVHLLGAAAWLGGLVPLLLAIRIMPPAIGALTCRWFSPLGKLCLYALVASAAYQGWELLGGVPGLAGTAYGWMVVVKAALFGALFGFAWINRYRLAPALRAEDGAAAKRVILRSIAVQTGFALAIVIAAGFLSSLPPGLHEQPIWPFPVQPSFVTIEEEPAFRREALSALAALGGAMLLVVFGVAIRRWRWPALALALVVIWFALPHLDLFFVAAYPTSFYRSPTNFAATTIATGAALFPANCVSCHGAEGRGDGPDAKGLTVPPADLTAGHLWAHSDGELFWWLTHGIEAPDGGPAMPGFAESLSEDQRWDLIDYIRARNAGLTFAATGGWPTPVPAPDLTVSCVGTRPQRLETLRGKVVQIILSAEPASPLPGDIPLVTVTVPPKGTVLAPSPATCIATDPAIDAAYAIASGLAPAQLAGVRFLVDPNGWLRALRPVGAEEGLPAEIARIYHHPIEAKGDAGTHHHPS